MLQLSTRCRFLYVSLFFLSLYPLPLFLSAIILIALYCFVFPVNVCVKLGHESKEQPEFPTEKETEGKEDFSLERDESERVEEEVEEGDSFWGDKGMVIREPDWDSPEVYNSRRVYSPSCSSFGSSRSERDWRRTLACKLFEERRSAKGEEMDSLWEAYEMDSCTPLVESIYKGGVRRDESMSELSFGDGSEKPCCLKAMKLTGEKMNMVRIGGSKLEKISKALKRKKWMSPKKNS